MKMQNIIITQITKELAILVQILCPSFLRIRCAHLLHSFCLIFLLLLVFIFMSAFIPVTKANNYLTRLELAKKMSLFFVDTASTELNTSSPYSDLEIKDFKKIHNIIQLGIMSCYTDNKFHPDALLSKFEVIYYLKTAMKQHQQIKVRFKNKLNRLVLPITYQTDDISSYYRCLLLKPTDNLSSLATKDFIEPIFSKNDKFCINGIITDSISHKPLSNAHLVINKTSIPIEKNGTFKFETNEAIKVLECFASSEGYKSLSFKRNSKYKNKFNIRLRPKELL